MFLKNGMTCIGLMLVIPFFYSMKAESSEVVFISGEEIKVFDGTEVGPFVAKADGTSILLPELLGISPKATDDESGFYYFLLDAVQPQAASLHKSSAGPISTLVLQRSRKLLEEGVPPPSDYQTLWLIQQDGNVRLISKAAARQAAFSPDGGKLAFISAGFVRVQSVSGDLLASIPRATCPVWSADGFTLALGKVPTKYLSLKSDDCSYVQLTFLNTTDFGQTFSLESSIGHCPLAYHPSKEWILYYQCADPEGRSLWTISLAKHEATLLPTNPTEKIPVPHTTSDENVWSKDGRWFLYCVDPSHPSKEGEVWGIEFDGKRFVRAAELDAGRLVHLPASSGIIAVVKKAPDSIPKLLELPK